MEGYAYMLWVTPHLGFGMMPHELPNGFRRLMMQLVLGWRFEKVPMERLFGLQAKSPQAAEFLGLEPWQ